LLTLQLHHRGLFFEYYPENWNKQKMGV